MVAQRSIHQVSRENKFSNVTFNKEKTGAPNTNRTCDLPLRRGLLYPLSYRGAGPIVRERC